MIIYLVELLGLVLLLAGFILEVWRRTVQRKIRNQRESAARISKDNAVTKRDRRT